MKQRYRAVKLDGSGARWQKLFHEFWPAYRSWFLKEGEAQRPDRKTCERALERHMPELAPTWRKLTELAGDDDLAARMLSLYRPPAYIFGCSQAVWLRGEPFLVRNYDYSPRLSEGVIVHSNWNGVRVVGMSDCLWGLVDGINEHGLALSLTFGGRKESGDGFGIPLILRYALETSKTIDEAVATLERIPSHMAYNVLALDASGRHAAVELTPDQPARVTTAPATANHQTDGVWPEYAAQTKTLERVDFLMRRLGDEAETSERFVERFAEDPLYQQEYESSFGTLYTAVYRPSRGRVEYIWPGFVSRQSVENFREGEALIYYGDPSPEEQAELEAWEHAAPAGEDWRRYLVQAPAEWRKYLPQFLFE